MKITIYAIIIIFGLTQICIGQELEQSDLSKTQIVAEAYYFGSGMSGITGEHLIARVFSDGKFEFDDLSANNQYIQKQSKISEEQLINLKKLLSNKNMEDIPNFIAEVYPTIDHTENIKLCLLIEERYKIIKIDNFKPNLPKTQNVYPEKLVTLIRFLESLRESAEIHFFFRSSGS
jgi:hypothetical protein